jgi:drug/metabolite transporter (DMT)-like permease
MNPRKTGIDSGGTLACLGALACWTVGPIFIKLLTADIDLWTQNLVRYITACVFWLPFMILAARQGRVNRELWKLALLPAGVNIVLQTFWAAAFYYIDPAFMLLLVKSSVLWIAGFSLIFFPEERRLIRSRRFWAGIVLSTAGVVGVVLGQEDFATVKTLTGIVFSLLAAFGWSVYTITAKIAFKRTDSRTGFSVITIYTVAGLLVLAFVFGKPGQCLEMGFKSWSWVVISGIAGIAVSHVLYYVSMKRMGATIPSLVMLATPFTVLALSHIVFGESLNHTQWVFGGVLVAGSALAIWAQEHIKVQDM